MNKTLLETFLQLKADQYIEPSRSGTPRGEPIGFSKVKYHASLRMLFDEKQKNIARALKISYGLLRKWNTEEPFKAMVNEHSKEFADFFIKETIRLERKYQTALSAFQDRPLAEIAKHELPRRIGLGLGDCDRYSRELLVAISNAVQDFSRRNNEKEKFPELLSVLSAYSTVARSVLGEEVLASLVKSATARIDFGALSKEMKLGLLEEVKKILLEDHISLEDRKRAFLALTRLGSLID